MKWIPVFVFASLCVTLQSKAQILNQATLQPSSNFYISGTGAANTFKSTAGTSVNGTAHFHMSNGDGNQQANLRWTQVLAGTEGTNNAGSDFNLFRYSNGGNYLGPGLTIERATGNTTIAGILTARNTSRIVGSANSENKNQSIILFMRSDNNIRDGYMGINYSDINPSPRDMYIVSDSGNIGLYPWRGALALLPSTPEALVPGLQSITH